MEDKMDSFKVYENKYTDEVLKNILLDLENAQKQILKLYDILGKSEYLDDETKENISDLTYTINQIFNFEMNKNFKKCKEGD